VTSAHKASGIRSGTDVHAIRPDPGRARGYFTVVTVRSGSRTVSTVLPFWTVTTNR
jgi:hypothetical protein